MDYIIREMKEFEYYLLDLFLYEAIFQRDNTKLLPKDIILQDDLQVYIKDFGTKVDDYCLCADINGLVVGAVWVRNIQGFGSVDHKTPEFAISVLKEYRNNGIGLSLMKQMLNTLKYKGYERTSLAVQKDNYAVRLYQSVGFTIIDENNEEYIMIWNTDTQNVSRETF